MSHPSAALLAASGQRLWVSAVMTWAPWKAILKGIAAGALARRHLECPDGRHGVCDPYEPRQGRSGDERVACVGGSPD
jgi:hypothetical protein